MRRLARLVAAAGLVLAGGLALPGGAAQAAACSGTTGVTVVIDKGSSSSTLCAADASSAMAVLQSVASVTQVQTQPGFICQINAYPNTSCVRTPPASAYWAFFHAPRGGSWTYSNTGAGSYDPPNGSVLGFAFGSGGAPSSPPPGAAPAPSPKPSPKPSPSSTSSKPSTPKPSTKPSSTSPVRPGSSASSNSSSGTSVGSGAGSSAAGSTAGAVTTKPGSATSTAPGATTSTTTDGRTPSSDPSSTGETVAAAEAPGSGSPATLFAGLGLVGLVGAAAAYLAVRRRATS